MNYLTVCLAYTRTPYRYWIFIWHRYFTLYRYIWRNVCVSNKILVFKKLNVQLIRIQNWCFSRQHCHICFQFVLTGKPINIWMHSDGFIWTHSSRYLKCLIKWAVNQFKAWKAMIFHHCDQVCIMSFVYRSFFLNFYQG